MSTHEFIVTVDVDEVSGDWGDRSEADYAEEALSSVGMREASNLDGFADVAACAWIVDVERM